MFDCNIKIVQLCKCSSLTDKSPNTYVLSSPHIVHIFTHMPAENAIARSALQEPDVFVVLNSDPVQWRCIGDKRQRSSSVLHHQPLVSCCVLVKYNLTACIIPQSDNLSLLHHFRPTLPYHKQFLALLLLLRQQHQKPLSDTVLLG